MTRFLPYLLLAVLAVASPDRAQGRAIYSDAPIVDAPIYNSVFYGLLGVNVSFAKGWWQ